MRKTRVASLLAVGIAAAAVSALTPPKDLAVAEESLRKYTHQKVDWRRCAGTTPATFQCATIEVPLDYRDPGGKKLDLAVSRIKATSTKERRGVLLLNPGGPAAPGLAMPLDPGAQLPEEVKRKYDLVGFDPRGIGRSSPLSCGLTGGDLNSDRPYRAETFAKDVRWARTVADKCRAEEGDRMRHITTRNTARDLDVLRAALGEKKVSYLGYSYGTYLGAVYMQMFPRRTDRFVLDSAADPAHFGRGTLQQIAKGSEPAFARWSEWTARRHATYHLGGTPAEVRGTFWRIVAQADREPLTFEGKPLTGDDIRFATRAEFFHLRKGAEKVAALKRAAEGGKPPPPRTPEPTPGPAEEAFARGVPSDNNDSGIWAVMCADPRTWPRDPERYGRDAVRDKARYPLYGDFASNITPCAFWKPADELDPKVDNKVRALVVQNAWDPQTPLPSGRAMHRALRGSRMVTAADGAGHGVYPFGSCADRTATNYLTTGRLPAKDLTCRRESR